MDREEAGKILAALVICTESKRSCTECPAYDVESGNVEQMRKCRNLLSNENIDSALEVMRG